MLKGRYKDMAYIKTVDFTLVSTSEINVLVVIGFHSKVTKTFL